MAHNITIFYELLSYLFIKLVKNIDLQNLRTSYNDCFLLINQKLPYKGAVNGTSLYIETKGSMYSKIYR